ncbi:hypothetical protein HU200_034505 [Digitaria exilis]|uniref:KIB1-4 beta-propeller domain-containing protein n=1 Tax=Digitaria exilis TaxID=1010633 RepID=A0A835EJS9_9POAL|nr:hypothetical protein HU200_034505 [Digitaria exilis]
MDAGKGTSADKNHHASLPVCARKGGKASRSRAAALAKTRCSTKCAPTSETPMSGEVQEPQHRPWADLPADIIGVFVGRLALVEDRARLRSVCRPWRATARLHRRPSPPLPMLVMSDFTFASFCPEGTLTGAHRRVPLPESETTSDGSVHCVGSSEGWLVCVERNKGPYFCDLRCFLMNPFSLNVIRLPPPSGKLYMLSSSEFTTNLIAFDICEDNKGLMISRVEGSVVDLPVVTDIYYETLSVVVEWRGKLLMVCKCSGDTEFGHMIVKFRVFEADLSTNPVRCTEIKDLDGDCIFISPCNSKSFRSSDYDGVGEDLVYLIDGELRPENSVYNMKDGTVASLGADELDDKFWVPGGGLMNATWVVHSVAPTQTRCSTKCAQASETPRSDEALDPQHRPWADLPADILGVVVGLFPLVEDRARLRSVGRAWRAAEQIHRRPPPPLPLLVMSDFKFASFCTEGILTGARRRIPLPEREMASAGKVRCVGSFEGWLGTLYMLSWREFSLHLIAFEICEDNNGLMISRVEGSVIELPVVTHDYYETWSTVEWRGKLLIVSTYSGFTEFGHMIAEVKVFGADLSTNPVRLSEIKNLGGDCIFISPCISKSFRSSDYDGVGEDLIYFTHGNMYPENFVYNMKDGMMASFAVDEVLDTFSAPDGGLMSNKVFSS